MADEASGSANRRLLNATAVMASGTLISRVLGFVRGMLLVIVLGATTPQADGYTLATLIPNTLYMIFAGGALNTVLVPQVVRHIKHDGDGGTAFINRIMTAFLVALAAVTVLATVLVPQVFGLWADDAWQSPAMAGHWKQLLTMAYLTMPQLFFYGAFFLIAQVLNAHDKFGPMMWAPILNNIVGIGVLGAYLAVWGTNTSAAQPFTDQQAILLGVGSTVGIVLQTLALIPAMRAIGFRYRPRFDLRGQGLGETFHLAKWMLGYVLLTSIVQIVVSNLASGATANPDSEGGAGLVAYQTAYLVWILPHSLLTVSLATAMLPSASRLAAARDMRGVASETTRTLHLATTFIVPASLGLMVLGHAFSRLAFGYGASSDTWPSIAWTLVAFAVGLVPYTVQYLYLRGFYALEDTRTPFFVQIVISVVNIAVALAIIAVDADPVTVAPRLALAYSFAYIVGAWATYRALKRRLPTLDGRNLIGHLMKLGVAALPGALGAVGISLWTLQHGGVFVVAGGFAASIVFVLGTFFFFAKRLGVTEASQLTSMLRRGRPGASPAPRVPDPAKAAELDTADAAFVPDAGAASDLPPASSTADMEAEPHVSPGVVLDGRYRLDDLILRRGTALTWRGFDLKLSRDVLVHVLHPDEPRALDILDEARRLAPVVDSRFLRVWDAVLAEESAAVDERHGSYIVCEYAPGQSLELALRQGTFSDTEAAWMTREIGGALLAMNALGLHHHRLDPDTIIVASSGHVKVVGFLTERPGDAQGGEAADVIALGRLLYAMTVGRWPFRPGFGMAAAPTDAGGRLLMPRQASARVGAEVSDIVDRILSPVPRGGASSLTTVVEVTQALITVTRGQDASRSIERRLRLPLVPAPVSTEAAPASAFRIPDAPRLTASVPPPTSDASPSDAVSPSLRGNPHSIPAMPEGHGFDGTTDDDVLPDDGEPSLALFDDGESTQELTPIPPPRPTDAGGGSRAGAGAGAGVSRVDQPSRRWQLYLLGAFVLTLAIGLVMVLAGAVGRRGVTAPEPMTHTVQVAQDFDPSGDGGDDAENPDLAPLAIDGDLSTAWTTERYGRSPDFNGRKPGAGVVLDLGEAKDVRWVTVVFGEGTTTGEVRVPVDDQATTPPLDAASQWRPVAKLGPGQGQVEVQLADATRTRFVLIYLTNLPKVGPNHVGAIHEVRIGG